MCESRLEPAASIIAKFGVARVVAITGKHISRVYRWMSSKERGGTGGVIPQSDAAALLAAAQADGIDLRPDEFFGLAFIPTEESKVIPRAHSSEISDLPISRESVK